MNHYVDTEGTFECCLFVLCFKCFQLPRLPCAYQRTAKGNLRIFFFFKSKKLLSNSNVKMHQN